MSNEFQIVTCCDRFPSENYYFIPSFEKSLRADYDKLLVLDIRMGKWKGLGTKLKWMHKAISMGLVKSDLVIYCDCWDFAFAVRPQELIDLYLLSVKSDLIISSEKNCYPADLKDDYDKLEHFGSPYRYLNSGLIIGKKDALFAALESMDLPNMPDDYRMDNGQNFHLNDQHEWQKTFLQQPVSIELDYSQIFCNTLHDVDISEFEFVENGEIINKVTNSIPLSYHANGSGKTGNAIQPILKHLNLL